MPTVYITAPAEAAPEIARTLVDERLAACVNYLECRSVYRWEGELVTDDEVILLAKTAEDRYDPLRKRLLEVHPHDVPCIERFDEADVLGSFEDWIVAETRDEQVE